MTPELYPTADQRERCGRCGEWDEDHWDACAFCGGLWHQQPIGGGRCRGNSRIRIQVLCRDGKGEFERMTRPD